MFLTIHLYGHLAKLGLKTHMMYIHQPMQTEQPQKDIRKKVVLGESQKSEKRKSNNGTSTSI
jgi:hypothetical protein